MAAFIVLGSGMILLYIPFGEAFKASLERPELIESGGGMALEEDWDKIENGIHLRTGLIVAEGFELVKGTCTTCHSAKLVIQNRASRQGWKDMIRWMQQSQGLWELGESEERILDYLAKHYAPEAIGRRRALEIAEWYVLEEEE
ncbi:MAG: hypothetical protein AAGG75_21770 [Bacteroidota bacterium]